MKLRLVKYLKYLNPTVGSKQPNCWVCAYFTQHRVVFNPAFFKSVVYELLNIVVCVRKQYGHIAFKKYCKIYREMQKQKH